MTWADFLEASTAEKLASGKLEPIAEYLKIDMGDDDTDCMRHGCCQVHHGLCRSFPGR